MVTAKIFEELKRHWKQQCYGMSVGASGNLGNLALAMFDDDTTLMAKSREEPSSMITDVKNALAKHGLNLNLDKCSIKTNTDYESASLQMLGVSVSVVDHRANYEGNDVRRSQVADQCRMGEVSSTLAALRQARRHGA